VRLGTARLSLLDGWMSLVQSAQSQQLDWNRKRGESCRRRPVCIPLTLLVGQPMGTQVEVADHQGHAEGNSVGNYVNG
jgi:hypothetical protein